MPPTSASQGSSAQSGEIDKMVTPPNGEKKEESGQTEVPKGLETVEDILTMLMETDDCLRASRQVIAQALLQLRSPCGFLGVVESGPTLKILAHEGFAWNLDTVPSSVGVRDLNSFLRSVIVAGKPVFGNLAGREVLGVPIVGGMEVIGLLAVASRAGGYSQAEQELLHRVAACSAVIVQKYQR